MNLMLPVATEIEAKRERTAYNSAVAAIATVFSKESAGRNYADALKKVLEMVREEQLAERGLSMDRHSLAAQKLVDAITKMPGITRK